MSATTDRLNFEMQDAKRNLDWLAREIEHLHEQRRKSYRQYYRAKAELKTLNEQNHAE